jgi:hypothetical protein
MAAMFIAGEINFVGAEGARVPPKLSGKRTAMISHLERMLNHSPKGKDKSRSSQVPRQRGTLSR